MVSGWNWDLCATYGSDKNEIYTRSSANRSLFIDTHFTPTNFYDGSFIATAVDHQPRHHQELRRRHGDAADRRAGRRVPREDLSDQPRATRLRSTRKAGSPIRASSRPTPAATAARTTRSTSTSRCPRSPTCRSTSPAATSTSATSATTRSASSPPATTSHRRSPLRGTVSTGFRAPTLAGRVLFGDQRLADLGLRAVAAQLAGRGTCSASRPLKPEKSTNYSVGFVAHPVRQSEHHAGRLPDQGRGTASSAPGRCWASSGTT